jgi:hypothetical protein
MIKTRTLFILESQGVDAQTSAISNSCFRQYEFRWEYYSSRKLSESMRITLDAGDRRILIPSSSVKDFQSVSGEFLSKFQNSFYADPIDAGFKAMGVE